ncbi:DNA-directed RNA polymerase sigma-70 factor [Fulvitalea axinellae]|uniref:DNA-directed RNA polymerase sigma-70 factor n=1 Tax=Fulvitalea axinellae TaxID=1182444 RepID=A0AAU9CGW8_9BACT|nr:DNA-directed RNA polymerase sigma-70 factor [Fulvitalea axinellae]
MYGDDYYLKKVKEGNLSAFDVLFRRYNQDMFRYAQHLTGSQECAEDIVQEVFLKLWTGRKRMKVCESLKPYLVRSVFNAFMDMERRGKVREKYKVYKTAESGGVYAEGADAVAEYRELEENVRVALDKLSPRQRLIFTKIRLEGRKYKDVASELGLSVKTVETHLMVAQKKIQAELHDFRVEVFCVLMVVFC